MDTEYQKLLEKNKTTYNTNISIKEKILYEKLKSYDKSFSEEIQLHLQRRGEKGRRGILGIPGIPTGRKTERADSAMGI